MKNSLSSSIASAYREKRSATDLKVTVVSPAVKHGAKLLIAVHQSSNDMYGEPIDKSPRCGITKQLLDDRPIGRSKRVAVQVKQLHRHQAPLVYRSSP